MAMPHSTNETPADSRGPRRLVLCFDGTGNVFEGNTSDTNIVKLYDKFDRKDPMQYHYYQTGIGTYNVDGGRVNKTIFGSIQAWISKKIDSGFATTFDAHVIAGYRFIMRYYKEGDKIYIFGFSRGAFTARFLSRMIYKVGLLSEGNEEMVPFAYDLYQQYEMGKFEAQKNATTPQATTATNGVAKGTETDPLLHKDCAGHDEQQRKREKLNAFKATFCRSEGTANLGVKVHFLGMFDCVSSVAVLDNPFGDPPVPVSVAGTAHHVRHAVAVDEHRVKFKAALLQQDKVHPDAKEDIKEVWFPGNHGDVGGGWLAPPHSKDSTRKCFESDPYQMSDVPLAWMIRELELIGELEPESAIKWSNKKQNFKTDFFQNLREAYISPMHDTLTIGANSSKIKTILWKFMEYLPIRRMELKWDPNQLKYIWDNTSWSWNKGSARDIPEGALLHDSLLKRLRSDKHSIQGHGPSQYRPSNNRGEGGNDQQDCLDPTKFVLEEKDEGVPSKSPNGFDEPSGIHNIYKLQALD